MRHLLARSYLARAVGAAIFAGAMSMAWFLLTPGVGVAAFNPASGQSEPAVAVNPVNEHQYVFWQGTNGHIQEAWYQGAWRGPLGMRWRTASSPGVGVTSKDHIYVFWTGAKGDIREAWYDDGWRGPRNLTSTHHWGGGGRATSAVGVAVDPSNGHRFLFWRGGDGRIHEAWYTTSWHGPRNRGWRTASSPAVGVTSKGHLYVFWRGTDGRIHEAWYIGSWRGPVDRRWRIHVPKLVGCVATGPKWVFNGPTRGKMIALTFDDGPWYDTPQFLHVLEEKHVVATFFQIGDQISTYGGKNGAIEKRMLRDGDMIGDHTWTHPDVAAGGSFARTQIRKTALAIQRATGGFYPCLFRAPYGDTSPALLDLVRSMGFTTIQWDVDPADWSLPGSQAIYQRVVDGAHPGAIVIQHDGGGPRYETLAALPREIDTLHARGYHFVTVAQLLGYRLIYK